MAAVLWQAWPSLRQWGKSGRVPLMVAFLWQICSFQNLLEVLMRHKMTDVMRVFQPRDVAHDDFLWQKWKMQHGNGLGMGCIMLHPDPLKLDDYFGIAWARWRWFGCFPNGTSTIWGIYREYVIYFCLWFLKHIQIGNLTRSDWWGWFTLWLIWDMLWKNWWCVMIYLWKGDMLVSFDVTYPRGCLLCFGGVRFPRSERGQGVSTPVPLLQVGKRGSIGGYTVGAYDFWRRNGYLTQNHVFLVAKCISESFCCLAWFHNRK